VGNTVSKSLTWLHFSDLHLKEKEELDPSLIALTKTLEQEANREHGLHLDLVLFSGDVAADGKAGYTKAQEFFNRLLSSAGLVSGRQRFCIVPGNHDLILTENAEQMDALREELEKDEDRAASFGDPASLEPVIKRFKGFQDFCLNYLGQAFDCCENRYFVRLIPVDGLRIGFVGFNSAWVSYGGGDDEYGHMFVGLSIVKEAFKKLESLGRPDMTIVMLHHPLEWLSPKESGEIEELVLRKADIVLTGHTHKRGWAHSEKRGKEGRPVLFLNVGATKKDEKRPQRLLIVSADVRERKLKVYPKKYDGKKWDVDSEFFSGMKGEYEPFDLSVVRERHTFTVRNTTELEQVANLIPYVENLAAGKFAEDTAWSIGTSVDFSKLKPLDLTTQDRMFVITGEAGIGKSTYMLWSLNESLRNPSWPFRKVIFLHPEHFDLWTRDLYDCDPDRTILVIDALMRWEDRDAPLGFQQRCRELKSLAFEGKIYNEKLIGPFKVIATLRDEEYKDFKQQLPPFLSTRRIEIKKEDLDLRIILRKCLASYGIAYEVPKEKEDEVIKKVETKSLGSPFYVRHLAAELKLRGSTFSEHSMDEFPTGMVNLIWQTIGKTYYIEADRVIPFLFLLFTKTNKSFSSYFFDFLVEKLAHIRKEEIKRRVNSLKEFYLDSRQDEVLTEDFWLNTHWRESLERGLERPETLDLLCRDVSSAFKTVEDVQYNRLLEQIIDELKGYLEHGFKDKADAFMCIDLAKLSDRGLEFATTIYSNHHSSSILPREYITHVQKELFQLWISEAWKYRAKYDDARVNACYKNGFEKIGMRSDTAQLHSYAHYLQKRILPRLKDGTPERESCKQEIEALYKEVIDTQSTQKVKDPISYQALAFFYAELGDDAKAEENFKRSLELDPKHIPSLQAYAIWLSEKGRKEWMKDSTKARDYYVSSELQFTKALRILEERKPTLSEMEIETYESRLLTAYAEFLTRKTSLYREKDIRMGMDKKIDEIYTILTEKHRNHGPAVICYARFLMGYARVLEKYKGGKNLEKAKTVLEEFVKSEEGKEQKDLSYFIALRFLARYFYKMDRLSPRLANMEKAEKLLERSSQSFDSFHNSVAFHELGNLYETWARYLEKTGDSRGRDERMRLVQNAYDKALLLVPENRESALHLSRIYMSYAFYLRRSGDRPNSLKCKTKALEILQKLEYVPFNLYFTLNSLGDEMLTDGDLDSAETLYTEAWELDKKLKMNEGYSLFRLGEISKKRGKIKEALEYYVQLGQQKNTAVSWGRARSGVRKLMRDEHIERGVLGHWDCIQARLRCSRKAWELDQNSAKNCGDYGEDLLEADRPTEALPVLKKHVSLIEEDDKLSEFERKKRICWSYKKIAFCHKRRREPDDAAEYFLKAAETEDSAFSYVMAIAQISRLSTGRRRSYSVYSSNYYQEITIAFQKFEKRFASYNQKERLFSRIHDTLYAAAASYGTWYQQYKAAMLWKDYADICYYTNPKGEFSYEQAGEKLMRIGKFLEARECFIKALRIKPNDALLLSDVAHTSMKLNRWDVCMVSSQKAYEIRKEPNDAAIYEISLRKKRERSRNLLNTVEAFMETALSYEILSKSDEALTSYLHAVSLLEKWNIKNRKTRSMIRFVADSLWFLGRKDDAKRLYEKIGPEEGEYESIITQTKLWLMKGTNRTAAVKN